MNTAMTTGQRVRVLALCGVAVLLSGCSTVAYYAQAVGGHLQVMRAATPVAERLADPATSEALRSKLLLAAVIREFASRELALPDNGSYRHYADLGRPFVLWNVFATPEFSVKPVESCFPVAGCVTYRGWYAEVDARQHAAEQRARGLDVHVGGVPAYSTLGWFDDPLLNTFLAYPDAEVARLVFHELAHQVAYAKEDTVFNESFAVAVEEEGMRRWLAAHAAADEAARYQAGRERRRQFIALILGYRMRLERFYSASAAEGEAARRTGKVALFAALDADYAKLKQSWAGFAGYDRFLSDGANNALLASIAAYSEQVPTFRALLAREQGDLAAFYREVKRLAGLPRVERDIALGSIAPAR
jgi:predicted aminopeptidase